MTSTSVLLGGDNTKSCLNDSPPIKIQNTKYSETQNLAQASKEIKEINQTVGQKQKPWAKTMDKSTPLKAVN